MQALSVDNDKRKKSLLLEELEQYGITFKVNEALEVSEERLRALLQEVKNKQDISNRSENWFIGPYESMMRDYISKLTVGSIFFFSCNPWAALFWPPYYSSYHYKKRQEREK